jgi:pSer/pThr/pTyr-binding forkhead associated (FHA) protein
MSYKICTTCKEKNDLKEFMCIKCANTIFEPPKEKPKPTNLKLIIDKELKPIEIESGDIVGREAKGASLLEYQTTISRQHAKFIYEEGEWYIEDISSNGIYIDSLDNRIDGKSRLKDGQIVFFSRSVEGIEIKIK